MLKAVIVATTVALAISALPSAALAAKPEIYSPAFSRVAVEGYDPVAYFTLGRPEKGSEAFTTTYKGAEFRFASAANLARFKANPGAYAPQFGGYCAWAVSQNYTAKGDAQYWRIVNGKLYLNYSADVQKKWEKNIPGFIAKGNSNWPNVIQK